MRPWLVTVQVEVGALTIEARRAGAAAVIPLAVGARAILAVPAGSLAVGTVVTLRKSPDGPTGPGDRWHVVGVMEDGRYSGAWVRESDLLPLTEGRTE